MPWVNRQVDQESFSFVAADEHDSLALACRILKAADVRCFPITPRTLQGAGIVPVRVRTSGLLVPSVSSNQRRRSGHADEEPFIFARQRRRATALALRTRARARPGMAAGRADEQYDRGNA